LSDDYQRWPWGSLAGFYVYVEHPSYTLDPGHGARLVFLLPVSVVLQCFEKPVTNAADKLRPNYIQVVSLGFSVSRMNLFSSALHVAQFDSSSTVALMMA